MRKAAGFTLIEVVVSLAILGVLLGLLLGAIHRVRVSALKTTSANNLRQFALATQQYADQNDGTIRNLIPNNVYPSHTANGGWSFINPNPYNETILFSILPLIDADKPVLPPPPKNPTAEDLKIYSVMPIVPTYTSPADPTLSTFPVPEGNNIRTKCSYAHNAQVFHDTLSLSASIPDGLSNTISFSERYFNWGTPGGHFQTWDMACPPLGSPASGFRRASFADPAAYDVCPMILPDGRTVATRRGVTFQIRPTMEFADSKLLQTPYDSGLLVAFFDGSVRTIRGGVSETSFWGMVTPAGGEVSSDD